LSSQRIGDLVKVAVVEKLFATEEMVTTANRERTTIVMKNDVERVSLITMVNQNPQ
jgi:hypothetical protein